MKREDLDSSDEDVVDEKMEGDASAYGGASRFLSTDPIEGVRKAVSNLQKEVADRSYEMKESLKPFLGKVFHAVGRSGAIYRYRIGNDGRLTMVKRLEGSYVVEKIRETKGKILAVPQKARRRWRAAVTGDPEKRIRDHMKETPQVKLLDKVSFTLGVIVICFSEFLLLRHPEFFPRFYYCLMPILFVIRYFEYSAIKSELYMIDFCYFVNLSVALQTSFYPDNLPWFQANFILSLGPICLAIVIWRNSLVFHSLDKITSFFLHSFPTMMCHINRWKLYENNLQFNDGYMGLQGHLVYPLIMYLTWQVGYLFMTEIVLRARLTADPEIVTSLRYLARDKTNSMNQLCTVTCTKLGFIKRGEPFDPDTVLAKVVFVLAQLGYTLATIVAPAFLYTSYHWSCLYIVFIFIIGVWNGASYYIEVFSKRYNLKFEAKTPASYGSSVKSEEDASEDDNSVERPEHDLVEFDEAVEEGDEDEDEIFLPLDENDMNSVDT